MTSKLSPSVAIVVPSFDRGGLEQVALNLYRGYRALGSRCIVLVERNEAGYMLGRLERPGDGIILNGDESLFVEALARHEIDVVHYHYSTFGLAAARRLGLFTLYTVHNVYTWLDDAGFAHHAGQIMEADRVVAVSRFVRDYFCRRAQVPMDQVDVIPNGIDLSWIAGAGAGTLPDLDIPAGRFVFVLPASYFPVKHHPLALRAAELLLSRRKDFHLVFVGNVGDEGYAVDVDTLVASSPARTHVSQVACLSHDQMAAVYQQLADCVVLPTIQEGCSNVVLEALAFDRSLIITDVGNAAEARALSPRVRVIDRAEEIDALTPDRIEALSRTGDCRNLRALVDAMASAMTVRGGDAGEAELVERREAIGLNRMVDGYHRLFRSAAPLALGAAPQAWAIPAASPSKTAETLA